MKEDSEKPKVSVIIPTYNSGRTLANCLMNAQKQTYTSCEIIVIDNLSSDSTMEIADSFGVKIIRQKSNPALARNIGIVNAAGEYVLILDSDQILSPTVIEECVEKCEQEAFGMIRIPEVFIGESFWGSCSALWKNYFEKIDRLYGAERDVMQGDPRFFVKEHVIRVGLLNPSLLWGEDYDLYEKLKKAGVTEDSCRSCLFHIELGSPGQIFKKSLRYGESIPVFMRQTKKEILPTLLEHSFLTFKEIFKHCRKMPAMIIGVAFLLYLKSFALAMGFLTGSVS